MEFPYIRLIVSVVEAEHRRRVGNGPETLEHRRAHFARRGVRVIVLGILTLKGEQSSKQLVVILVRDGRTGQYVIGVVVPLDLFSQTSDLGFYVI